MIVDKETYEAMLEHQKTYVPCGDKEHTWVDDEENEGERYCSNCMLVKDSD